MPCLDCLEKRARFLKAIGLARFAPDLSVKGPQFIVPRPSEKRSSEPMPYVAKVATVSGEAALMEFDLPAPIRRQFAAYLEASDGATVQQVVFAAVNMIAFALATACEERRCMKEQIDEVCATFQRMMDQRFDRESGRKLDIVQARALLP